MSSICKTYSNGKDKVVFTTKEEQSIPSTVELPPVEPQTGLLMPNGDINWNCPCLGGMATGPCGVEFREAFSCFHYSEAEPKGSDCYDAFKTMQVPNYIGINRGIFHLINFHLEFNFRTACQIIQQSTTKPVWMTNRT